MCFHIKKKKLILTIESQRYKDQTIVMNNHPKFRDPSELESPRRERKYHKTDGSLYSTVL